MPLELVEDAAGDPRNARALALASDLSYLSADEGSKAFRDQLGLDAQLISVDNTQVYVAKNDEHVVVAFRGTESPNTIDGLKDWLLTDAVNLLMVPEGRLGTDLAAAGVGARFHQGFIGALGKVWEPLFPAVEAELKRAERPLWVTGHSLGGALAQLAGWLFQRKFVAVHQVYTYGAPMVGNRAAAQAFDREFGGKIFRYVNAPDPVPKLPTISLIANDYGHCEREIALGAASGGSLVDLFQGLAAKTVDGLLNATLMDEVWTHVLGLVNAHFMENYRKLIDKG